MIKNFQELSKVLQDIEDFKAQIHEYPDEILDKVKEMIWNEQRWRLENTDFELMNESELKLSKVHAIRAYRERTNTTLMVGLEVWKRSTYSNRSVTD